MPTPLSKSEVLFSLFKMRRFASIALGTLLLVSVATALDASLDSVDVEQPFAPDVLRKKKIAELRSILSEYDAECEGCTEKRDFVDRVLEVQKQPKPVKKVEAESVNTAAKAGAGSANKKPFAAGDASGFDAQIREQLERQQRLKKRLAEEGLDDLNIGSGLSGGGGMDDDQLIDFLRTIKKGKPADVPADKKAGAPRGKAARAQTPEPAAAAAAAASAAEENAPPAMQATDIGIGAFTATMKEPQPTAAPVEDAAAGASSASAAADDDGDTAAAPGTADSDVDSAAGDDSDEELLEAIDVDETGDTRPAAAQPASSGARRTGSGSSSSSGGAGRKGKRTTATPTPTAAAAGKQQRKGTSTATPRAAKAGADDNSDSGKGRKEGKKDNKKGSDSSSSGNKKDKKASPTSTATKKPSSASKKPTSTPRATADKASSSKDKSSSSSSSAKDAKGKDKKQQQQQQKGKKEEGIKKSEFDRGFEAKTGMDRDKFESSFDNIKQKWDNSDLGRAEKAGKDAKSKEGSYSDSWRKRFPGAADVDSDADADGAGAGDRGATATATPKAAKATASPASADRDSSTGGDDKPGKKDFPKFDKDSFKNFNFNDFKFNDDGSFDGSKFDDKYANIEKELERQRARERNRKREEEWKRKQEERAAMDEIDMRVDEVIELD